MAVKIKITGNRNTPEFKAAKALKAIFQQDISSNAEGHIVILCNATLFGQVTKDVDLIAYGNLKGFRRKLKFRDDNNRMTSGEVFINNFCFCFETKRHAPRDIVLKKLLHLQLCFQEQQHS